MKRFQPNFKNLLMAALIGAVGVGLSPALFGAPPEPASPLFAPANPKQPPPRNQEAEKTSPAIQPSPPVKAGAAPLASDEKDPVESPITLKTNSPEQTEESTNTTLNSTTPASFAPPLEFQVDALGNKTLVIHGDQTAQILFDEPGGGQVQVLIGDDTAGLLMDNQGRKTLVVRGDPEQPPAAAGSQTIANTPPPIPSLQELPYWLIDTEQNTGPYWEVEEIQPVKPYWLEKENEDDRPYWQVAETTESTRPYWLPESETIEVASAQVQLMTDQTQAPPRPLAAPASSESMAITYYMYQDELGVKHLTNIPNDPRYRLFTAVVTVQRGLAAGGPRIRFTHETLRPVIMRAALTYNLDPSLIAAVIKSESAFDSRAVSWAGAQGLMQLIPRTAREMGVQDPFDPEENVMGGSRYLRKMLDQFGGDLTLAIAAYNCGPSRVAKAWRVPNIAETQNYVVIVLRNYERYKLMF